MSSVLVNLLRVTFKNGSLPAIAVKYAAALGLLLVLSWPISGLVGRDTAPSVFTAMIYVQALVIPFIVNSFVTGRIELAGRISLEDWVCYTPVPLLGITAASQLYALILCCVFLLAGMPFSLIALPVAGDSLRTLLTFYCCIISFTVLFAGFAHLILLILPIDLLVSGVVDVLVGFYMLLSLNDYTSFAPQGIQGSASGILEYLGPIKALKASAMSHGGPPWEVIMPLAAAVGICLIGALIGRLIRGKRSEPANA